MNEIGKSVRRGTGTATQRASLYLDALLWTEDDALLKAAPHVATDTAHLRERLRV